jgi:hypothetical protein
VSAARSSKAKILLALWLWSWAHAPSELRPLILHHIRRLKPVQAARVVTLRTADVVFFKTLSLEFRQLAYYCRCRQLPNIAATPRVRLQVSTPADATMRKIVVTEFLTLGTSSPR